MFCFVDVRNRTIKLDVSDLHYVEPSSNTSKISTTRMENILNKLKLQNKRDSTAVTYLSVWRKFNSFIIQLDKIPPTWEERIALFGAFLVQTGKQSCTIKSYYSAIKATLRDDDYAVNNDRVMLITLTKACKLVND